MTHYSCLVVGEDPEAMLLPFDENLDVEEYKEYEAADPAAYWAYEPMIEKGFITAGAGWPAVAVAYNPRGQWDWYQLGGRWRGFWMLKSDLTYPEDVVRAELHYGEDPATPIDRQYADTARKADIDFAGMAALAEAEAVSVHARVRAVLDGAGGPPEPFAYFREMYNSEHDSVIQRAMVAAAGDSHAAPAGRAALEMARRAYWSQPAVKALEEAHLMPYGCDVTEVFCLDETDPRDAYADRVRRNRFRTHALLTAEGWAEAGSMGWFATVSDEDPSYERVFDRVLDALPGHALLSLYDLHT